jgi:hypothetical protein
MSDNPCAPCDAAGFCIQDGACLDAPTWAKAKPSREEAEQAGRDAYRAGLPCIAPDYGWGDRRASWRVGWKRERAAQGDPPQPSNRVDRP